MGRRRRGLSPNQDIVWVKQFYYFNHSIHYSHLFMLLRIRRGKYYTRADAIGSVDREHNILYKSRRQSFPQQIYTRERPIIIIIITIIIPVYYILCNTICKCFNKNKWILCAGWKNNKCTPKKWFVFAIAV